MEGKWFFTKLNGVIIERHSEKKTVTTTIKYSF